MAQQSMCYWTLKWAYVVTEVRFNRESSRESVLMAYKKAGRWIVRAFGPWARINQAFRRGLAEDGVFNIESAIDSDE
jgi:hypothetical protein